MILGLCVTLGFFFYTFLHFPILLYKRYALKTFKNRDLELLTRH